MTRVPGVARVQVFGAGQYAMRVWVKPDQLAKLGVTVPQIVSAIQAQNTVNPAGQIGGEPVPKGQQFTYAVRAQGRLQSPEEFGDIILRANPGWLHASAQGRGARGTRRADLQPGGPVQRQTRRHSCLSISCPARTRCTLRRQCGHACGQLKQKFPARIWNTRWAWIPPKPSPPASTKLNTTLIEALVLVVLVVYMFLQGWRATLIPLLGRAGFADRNVRHFSAARISPSIRFPCSASCWRSDWWWMTPSW